MRKNFYKEQLALVENAMHRECAPDQIETGFWRGLERRRNALITEYRSYQAQLYELVAEGDVFAREQYLDLCDAIDEEQVH